MKKRAVSLMLSAILIMCLLTSVPVSAAYTVNKTVEKGFEITEPAVTEADNGYFSVSFDVKNTLWSKANAQINVQLVSASRVLARTTVTRYISARSQTSVFLEASEGASGTVAVNITVVNPQARNEIFVSPDGKDTNPGSSEKPLKTVAGAVRRLYDMDEDYFENEDITLIFKDGEYNVNSTVGITDAHTKKLNSLTLKAENKGRVNFVGGLKLSGSDFYQVTDTAMLANLNSAVHGRVYAVNLADYGINLDFTKATGTDPMVYTLYYNDAWQTMARYPNDSRLQAETTLVSSVADWSPLVRVHTVTDSDIDTDHKTGWLSTDISETWSNNWLFWDWEQTKGRLTSVTDTGVTVEVRTSRAVNYTRDNGTYYLYNMPYEIDTEGEYAILGNVLYFYPNEADVASGAFENADIELNCDRTDMITVNTDNVSVENIAFENSQADFIQASGSNISILGCEFFNNGSRAVSISGNNNLVSACDFHDLGGVGIAIGGGDKTTLTPSGSVLENCYFDNNGIVTRTGAAAFSLSGVGVTARRNTIRRAPHSAINYSGNDHVIEYNDMAECLTDNSGDAGIIYTGRSLSNLGTIIQYNYIHDSNSGLGSIYWDDRISGQRANNNVFENINRVLFIHAGICNSFNGNIVIKAENATTENAVSFRGRTYYVEGDSGDYTDSDGNKYLLWYTQPFIDKQYSHTYNTFMAHLVGSDAAALGSGYPGVPWENEYWQNAYSAGSATDSNINTDENYRHVLNYVNYKQTRKIEETVIKDNHFIGFSADAVPSSKFTTGIIKSNQAWYSSDFINASTEMTTTGNTKADALAEEWLTRYENVVNNSGIYVDEYRTSVE